MGNMSYCRFSNTLGDLNDCADALSEAVDENSINDDLGSREETRARRNLVRLCQDIANDYAEYFDE